MRIALVYDQVNKWGGAERVLLALREIWPEAPLYTAVYYPQRALWAKVFKIKTSFLQSFPWAKSKHEFYAFLAPLAFESFDFSSFEVVFSITSSFAKGIITSPSALHLCYCLTPTRYLWSSYQDYLQEPGIGVLNPLAKGAMRFFTPFFRREDYFLSQRPDFFLAISQTVRERIERYYHRDSLVVYPPVETDFFQIAPSEKRKKGRQNYFLIVSRLVPYKKIDYAIFAFNKLGWSLKIVGEGLEKRRLENLAKGNIEFLGEVSDIALRELYQNCQALIFPQEEDFGLVSLEAQACGKPVIAFRQGGARETVVPGKTGELYSFQTVDSLIEALKKFQNHRYTPLVCRRQALRFSRKKFQEKIKNLVESFWQKKFSRKE